MVSVLQVHFTKMCATTVTTVRAGEEVAPGRMVKGYRATSKGYPTVEGSCDSLLDNGPVTRPAARPGAT